MDDRVDRSRVSAQLSSSSDLLPESLGGPVPSDCPTFIASAAHSLPPPRCLLSLLEHSNGCSVTFCYLKVRGNGNGGEDGGTDPSYRIILMCELCILQNYCSSFGCFVVVPLSTFPCH